MTEQPTAPAPACDQTAEELLDTLTGFDEIAIDRQFGFDPYVDAEAKPVMTMRALVFVHRRRQGDSDQIAYQTAMGMTIGVVTDYFVEEDAGVAMGEPDTESGKGSSVDVSEPSNSLRSA